MKSRAPDHQILILSVSDSLVWRARPLDPETTNADHKTAHKQYRQLKRKGSLEDRFKHIEQCLLEHHDFAATPRLLRQVCENEGASSTFNQFYKTLSPAVCTIIGVPLQKDRPRAIPADRNIIG
jgi:hypothetical protein